jgi:hypothetical protein
MLSFFTTATPEYWRNREGKRLLLEELVVEIAIKEKASRVSG